MKYSVRNTKALEKRAGTVVNIHNGDSNKDDTPKGENAVTKGLRAGAGAGAAATVARGVIEDHEGDTVLGHAKKLKQHKADAKKNAEKASAAKEKAHSLKDKWFAWGEKSKAQKNYRFYKSREKNYANTAKKLSKKLSSSARAKLALPASVGSALAGASYFTSNKDERDEARKAKEQKSLKKTAAEKKKDQTANKVGAALAGTVAGGGVLGGYSAYKGAQDKEDGKNNVGKHAAGHAALGGAVTYKAVSSMEKAHNAAVDAHNKKLRNTFKQVGKLKIGKGKVAAVGAGITGALGAGRYAAGRLFTDTQAKDKTKSVAKKEK